MATIPIPKTFSDINLSMKRNPVTKDLDEITNEQAVQASILNILATGPYERLFRPDLGAGLKEMLFEPMTALTATRIEGRIRSAIQQQEPRVTCRIVTVVPNEERQLYDIFVTCEINDTKQEIEVTQTLQRGR
tara:strand:+ start:1684 stop:2082 length:399 start_codon:yes stop_codon:yes gene_type:complete